MTFEPERRREQRRGTGRDPYAGCPPESFRLAEMGEVDCYGHERSGSDRRRPVPEPSDIERENARHRAAALAAVEESAGVGLAVGGEGVVGSLVERLATRWKAFAETYPSAGEIPVEDDARFFLRAIADEIATNDDGSLRVWRSTGLARTLRMEADR